MEYIPWYEPFEDDLKLSTGLGLGSTFEGQHITNEDLLKLLKLCVRLLQL